MHQFHRPWLIAWLIKPGLIEPVRLYYDFEHLQTTTPHRSWRSADPWSSVKLEIEVKGKKIPKTAPPSEDPRNFLWVFEAELTQPTKLKFSYSPALFDIPWNYWGWIRPRLQRWLTPYPKLLAMSFSTKHSTDKNFDQKKSNFVQNLKFCSSRSS